MTVKQCRVCDKTKSLEDFCKDKSMKDGRRNICKRCHTDYMINYYKNNPDKTAAKNKMNTRFVPAWKRHHLDESVYLDMFNKYNGLCHSCKNNKAEVIDHDHSCCKKNRSCGKCVRGILCRQCNLVLGILEEDKGKIKNLLNYID